MSDIEYYEKGREASSGQSMVPREDRDIFIEDGYYGASARYEGSDDAQEGTSHVRWVVSTLLKHWILIVAINVLATAFTIAYVAQAPDYYTTEARVQINAEINQAVSTNAVVVNNPGSDPGYFSTQLEILNGSTLMRRVIKWRDLENNQDFLNPGHDNNLTAWQNIGKMLGFYTPPLSSADQIAVDAANKKNDLSLQKPIVSDPDKEAERLAPYVDRLRSGLVVKPVQGTRLIEISYTSRHPDLAAKIANAIGDTYVLQNLESKVNNNVSAGDFLQKRVAELQSEIRRGEERLINYTKSNRVIPLDANQNTVVDRFGELNKELGAAEGERIAAAAALEAAINNPVKPANNAQIAALESQKLNLEQRLVQLKTLYTEDWPEVKEVRKQIENVGNQISALSKRASDQQLAALRERLAVATSKEQALRQSFEVQRNSVIAQNEASINYKIIEQEIESNKLLLTGLLQRTKENEAVVAGTQNNVLVQDRATIPQGPSGPDRTKNVILAFILSLGFGVGLAFALEWFNDSLNSAENVEGILGLPVLASIPSAPLSFTQALRGKVYGLTKKSRRSNRQYNLGWFSTPQFKETYYQLGVKLILARNGNRSGSLLVTSAEEGEGKSINALCLATSLAETSGNAILIDGDLRCPRIHTLRRLDNSDGLTNLLGENKLTDERIKEAIKKDPESDLDILTSGPSGVSPVNLLSSDQMVDLLERLASMYTHVIIDSPPLTYFADGLVLARLVDSVLIVVRDEVTSKGMVLKVKSILQRIGANVSGVVINGVERSFKNYYEYYDSDADIVVESGLEQHKTQSLNLKD